MTVVDESERLPSNPHTPVWFPRYSINPVDSLFVSTARVESDWRLEVVVVFATSGVGFGCNLLSRIDLDGRILFFFFLCFCSFSREPLEREITPRGCKKTSRRYLFLAILTFASPPSSTLAVSWTTIPSLSIYSRNVSVFIPRAIFNISAPWWIGFWSVFGARKRRSR